MAWSGDPRVPSLTPVGRPDGLPAIVAEHRELGELWLVADAPGELLFTDNETNAERLWGAKSRTQHVKDAFHRHVVGREPGVTNAGGLTVPSFYDPLGRRYYLGIQLNF